MTTIFPKFTLLRTLPKTDMNLMADLRLLRYLAMSLNGILKTSLNINGVDVFRYILCTVLVGI